MSILSDTTLRELCDKPVLSCEQIEHDIRNNPIVREEIKQWAAEHSPNHPHALEMLELQARIDTAFLEQEFGMIYPFTAQQIRTVDRHKDGSMTFETEQTRIISKGLTSYGYDVSLTEDVKLFTNLNSSVIDPKRFDGQHCLVDAKVHVDEEDDSKYVILPPNSYLLGRTYEYFRIPRDIMVICLGKSTYARCGAIVNTTPIEPGFHGNVVIEISNSTPSPLKIYLNEGIAQFLFLRGDRPCETSYGDRGGKYQGQTGVTLPKV